MRQCGRLRGRVTHRGGGDLSRGGYHAPMLRHAETDGLRSVLYHSERRPRSAA